MWTTGPEAGDDFRLFYYFSCRFFGLVLSQYFKSIWDLRTTFHSSQWAMCNVILINFAIQIQNDWKQHVGQNTENKIEDNVVVLLFIKYQHYNNCKFCLKFGPIMQRGEILDFYSVCPSDSEESEALYFRRFCFSSVSVTLWAYKWYWSLWLSLFP